MTFEESLIGRPNTIKTHTSLYNRWIKNNVQFPIGELEVLALIRKWQGAGLSSRTIRSVLSVLGKYAKFSGEQMPDLATINRLVLRSEQQKRIRTLSKSQVRTLVNSIEEEDFRTLVSLGVFGGLRLGEAFGLTWRNIDVLKGEMLIEKSYDGPTKSGKSRIVPISRSLEKMFLAKIPMNSDNIEEELVLPRSFDPNPRLKVMCRNLKLPEITFHGLRHTFATLALEAGRSPKQVQETLGHSKLSTTIDLYWQSLGQKMDLNFIDDE